MQANVVDPLQVQQTMEALTGNDKYDVIVIDTLTYLMDMYETQYVINSANSMKMWGEYAQFFKRIMQEGVAKSDKQIIFTAHTSDIYNESEMVSETMVKVKGSLMNQGIESYFSTVIATKKVPIKTLEKYKNDLLTITPEEERLEFKYCYQTQLTKETVNERIRGPIGMWLPNETFIDNNAQLVLDRLKQYYA